MKTVLALSPFWLFISGDDTTFYFLDFFFLSGGKIGGRVSRN
jgi:hypothetical protein